MHYLPAQTIYYKIHNYNKFESEEMEQRYVYLYIKTGVVSQ